MSRPKKTRRRRRFTTGRALVLLALAVVGGVALYLSERISGDSLAEQARLELEKVIAPDADVEIDRIELDVDRGIIVHGIRIRYPDGEVAIRARKIIAAVDHKDLLSGDVNIRQIDVWGLVCNLRVPEPGAAPEFPGVFKPTSEGPTEIPKDLPTLRIRGASHLEVSGSDLLAPGVPLRLECQSADGWPDGPNYRLEALFRGERVESIAVELTLDRINRTLDVRPTVKGMRWGRKDARLLAAELRAQLPPVELAGVADFEAHTKYDLERGEPRKITGEARLRELEGAFGNLHTGARAGLPFGVRGGTATLRWNAGVLAMPDFAAEYVSPRGRTGALTAQLHVDFRRVEPHLDVALQGRGFRAETDDLRLLLPPDAVESMVEQFLPSGTFDFDLTITHRPAFPETVTADLKLSEGNVIYAGRLDELTGQRFGFHYPVDRAAGDIRIETHVVCAYGRMERVEIDNLRGFRATGAKTPDAPKDVKVVANGLIRGYTVGEDEYREDVGIVIDVRDLPIDNRLATAFASTPRGAPYSAFDLSGWASRVKITIDRDAFLDEEPITTYDVTLRDCAMAYEDFPLRIQGVNGTIVSRDLRPDAEGLRWRVLELKDLRGHAIDGGEIVGRGLVTQRDDGTEDLELSVIAENLVVGADLERALRASRLAGTGVVDLWSKLRPSGRLNASLTMHGPGDPEILIDLGGTTSIAGYGDADCPCEGLVGEIHFRHDVATLRDIRGVIAERPFELDGTVKENGYFQLQATVTELPLRSDVRALIAELSVEADAGVTLLALEDDSRTDVTMTVERPSTDAPLTWSAALANLDLQSGVFGLPVRIQGGPVALDPTHLNAANLRFRSGQGDIQLKELFFPMETAVRGFAVLDARDLDPVEHLEPIFGSGFRETLGDNARIDLKSFRVEFDRRDYTVICSGAVDLRRHEVQATAPDVLEPTGALGLSPLTLKLPANPGDPLRYSGVIEFRDVNMNIPIGARDMAGELRIAEGTLTPDFTLKGAVFGGRVAVWERAFEDLSLNLTFTRNYMRFGNIDGRFYKGSCRGDIEVHLADPGAFKVRLRAENVALDEMLKEDLPRGKPMAGSLSFAIEAESASGLPQHMKGRGEIRVRDGKLFEVPGLRKLLSVLARATPLKPHFREADMDFVIEGETLRVDRIHLSTAINDVYARGEISIFGDLNLVIQPQVARLVDLPRLIDVPVLSTLRALWHKTVYEIRMEGTLESPALRLRGLPFLRRARQPFTQSPHAGRPATIRPRLLP